MRWDTMIVVQFFRTPSFSMQVSQRPLVTFRVPASSSHCVHSFPAMAIIASNAPKKKSREVSKFLLKQLTCSTWCTNYVLLVQWIMNLFKFVLLSYGHRNLICFFPLFGDFFYQITLSRLRKLMRKASPNKATTYIRNICCNTSWKLLKSRNCFNSFLTIVNLC